MSPVWWVTPSPGITVPSLWPVVGEGVTGPLAIGQGPASLGRGHSFTRRGQRPPHLESQPPPSGGGSMAQAAITVSHAANSQPWTEDAPSLVRGPSFPPGKPWSLPRGRRPLLPRHGAGPTGPRLSRSGPGGRARGLGAQEARAGRVAFAGGGGRLAVLGLVALLALLAGAPREPGSGQVVAAPGRVGQDGGRYVAGGRPGPGALLPDAAVHTVPREDAGPGAPRLVQPYRQHSAAGRAAAAEHDSSGEPGREAGTRRGWEPGERRPGLGGPF